MLLISKPEWAEGRSAKSNTLALAGMLLMVGSLFAFDSNWAFPGFIVLAPVTGTTLIIYTRRSRVNQIVGNRALVYIGLISYSWYLWHWPLMAFVRAVVDTKPTLLLMLTVGAVSFVAAALSQRYIEKPFRHAHFSTSGAALRRYAFALSAAVAIPATLYAFQGWPSRQPAQVTQIEAVADELKNRPCLLDFPDVELQQTGDCMPKGASVALIGDSHAAALARGLSIAAQHHGLRVAQITKAACVPMIGITMTNQYDSNFPKLCAAFNENALRWVQSHEEIKTVILAGVWPATDHAGFRRSGPAGSLVQATPYEAVSDGVARFAADIKRAGKRLVIVGDVPRWNLSVVRHLVADQIPFRSALRWITASEIPSVMGRVDENILNSKYSRSEHLVQNIARNDGAVYFSIREQLCNGRSCLIEKDGRPLFMDDHHLSNAGSDLIKWPPL